MSFSVIVKAFMRPDMVDLCLSSLDRLKTQPDIVVVADDGYHTSETLDVYERHKDTLNLKPLLLPYNVGLSEGRNRAFKACSKDSPYILLLDDDMEPPSNIYEVHEVMEEDLSIGGVSPLLEEKGEIHGVGADILFEGRYCRIGVYGKKEVQRTSTGIGYYIYDYISNCALFRREALEAISGPWDPEFVIGYEHTDFYIRQKKLNSWRFALTPDYVARHTRDPFKDYAKKDIGEDSFLQERYKREKLNHSYKHLCEKHGLKGHRNEFFHIPTFKTWRSTLFHWVTRRMMPVQLYCLLTPHYEDIRKLLGWFYR